METGWYIYSKAEGCGNRCAGRQIRRGLVLQGMSRPREDNDMNQAAVVTASCAESAITTNIHSTETILPSVNTLEKDVTQMPE